MRAATAEREGSVFARVARERREAHEPPEARGLRRDEVRMLVAAGATGARIQHARARELPTTCAPATSSSSTPRRPCPRRCRPAAPTRRRCACTSRRPRPERGRSLGRRAAARRRALRGRPRGRGARAARGREGDTARAVPRGRAAGREARRGRARPRGGLARRRRRLARPPDGPARRRRGAPAAPPTRLWLATIDTGDTPLLDYLARHGAPIRYAHTRGEHPLDDYQTIFALHPGSAEMPSAARPFTPELVTTLVARGIVIAPLTLHTGVSSLEAGELPYPERFACPRPPRASSTPRARTAAASSPSGRPSSARSRPSRCRSATSRPTKAGRANPSWSERTTICRCWPDGVLWGGGNIVL